MEKQEVLKSELDLFEEKPYQNSIESSQIVEFRPVGTISENPSTVEFYIPGSDEYLDLQESFLIISLKATKEDGGAYEAATDDKFAPISGLAYAMWSQVDVYLNETLISQSSNIYPWRSHLQNLICASQEAKMTWLRAAGYYKDEETNVDGIETRKASITKKSNEFTMVTRIYNDLFFQNRLLLNGISLKIILTRAKDEFCFMALDTLKPKLILKNISLYIRKVKVNPSILVTHAKVLNSGKQIKYPIVRTELKSLTLPGGVKSGSIDNVFMQQLPRLIILGFIELDAYTGSYQKNPFAFKNLGLNYLSVNDGSISHPVKPYTPDYSKNMHTREFFEFFVHVSQAHGGNVAPDISFLEFKEMYCLYAFNLSPDLSMGCGGSHISLPKRGNIRIDYGFETATANMPKLICLAEFDNTILIDNSHQVILDY